MNWLLKARKHLAVVILVPLAILMPLRLLALAITSCSNAPAVDEASILPIVDLLFEIDPNFSWLAILRKCDVGSINLLPTVLFDTLLAYYTSYDVRIQLVLGILLHFTAAILMASSLPSRYGKFWMLIYSAEFLILSSCTSLSTIFFNGQTCISSGLLNLFVSISVLSTCKLEHRKGWMLLLSLSNLCLAFFGRFYFYSIGLSLFAGLILSSNFRLLRKLAVSLFPGAIVCFFIMKPAGNVSSFSFDAHRALGTIGLALSSGFANTLSPTAESLTLGVLGALVSLLLFYAMLVERIERHGMIAPITIGTFGLISVLAVTLFRTSVYAWYTGISMNIWLSLIGLATICMAETTVLTSDHFKTSRVYLAARTVSLITIIAILLLTLRSDLTYADKDYFRLTHSPASESAIRNFEQAPTIAEQYVSPGPYCGLTHPSTPLLSKIAPILKKRRWSSCSENQIWLLQGDYLLPTVTEFNSPTSKGIAWIEGSKTRRKKRWDDPEHLNLRFSSGDSVYWTVHIPHRTHRAKFVTEVYSTNPEGNGIFALRINQATTKSARTEQRHCSAQWQKIHVDLSSYAGSEIQIQLNYNSAKSIGQDFLIAGKPRIVLNGIENIRRFESSIPCNTSISSIFPSPTESDLLLPPANSAAWISYGLEELESEDCTYRIVAPFSKKTLNRPLAIPVSRHSFLCLDLQQDGVGMTFCCIQLTINGSRIENIFLPILKYPKRIEHAIDLKHYSFEPGDLITGITIFPSYHQVGGKVFLKSLRFVRKRPHL